MKIITTLLFLFVSVNLFGQKTKILGAVMLDDNGITTDQQKAKFLVVEKKIDDTTFEKLIPKGYP